MNTITKCIIEKIGQPELLEQFSGLSQSVPNSLFQINKTQTNKLTPAKILKSYRSNRFVAPSALDPAKFYQLEADMTCKASSDGIKPVLLSPVAPLGSSSVFGCVDQNNVMVDSGEEIIPFSARVNGKDYKDG